MKNGDKLFLLILPIFFFLAFVPISTSANSPSPGSLHRSVTLQHASGAKAVAVYLADEDGVFFQLATIPLSGSDREHISFDLPKAGSWQFRLELIMEDGTTIQSNTIECFPFSFYYDVSRNHLKSDQSYSQGLLFFILLFGLPLLFTYVIEFLVSLPFGIRSWGPMFGINSITNPIMNFLLFGLMLVLPDLLWPIPSKVIYYTLVVLSEIIVVWMEYRFYIKKYTCYTRKVLLWYSVSANIASWLLFVLLAPLFF